MVKSCYQVGGSLPHNTPTYVRRRGDEELYKALLAGKFCYVFNARQMGKSSLRVRVQQQLQGLKYKCVYLDMTQLGCEEVTHQQWYRGVMLDLLRNLQLLDKLNLRAFWQTWEMLPIVQQFHLLMDEILAHIPETRIFIFVDEIDSILSLKFPVNDFFAFIRSCHEMRPDKPGYGRLTWALFGVVTPSELICDRSRTPFNIGHGIHLQDFHLQEVQPLLEGLQAIATDPQAILKAILFWTGGQPLLTQKLCQQVMLYPPAAIVPGREAELIAHIVRSHLIQNWESQDDPEHLRTIANRLVYDQERAGKLLTLYQQILTQGGIATDGSQEQIYLLLSGLVRKHQGQLQVKNPIYREIFNQEWITQQLNSLRPYSPMLTGWVASGKVDTSWLLRGKALGDAQEWVRNKNLSTLDYEFLQASLEVKQQEIQQQLETERLQAVNARLVEEQRATQLKLLTDNITVGTYITIVQPDGTNHFTFVSDRWLEICGFSREEFMSNQDLAIEVIHPEERQSLLDLNRTCIDNRLPFRWRGRLLSQDKITWVSIESNPRVFPDGSLVWEGVMIDITQGVEAQQQLSRVNAELEERVARRTEQLQLANQALSRSTGLQSRLLWLLSLALFVSLGFTLAERISGSCTFGQYQPQLTTDCHGLE
jgi:PAS domain S-box-containing protein